MSKRRTGKHFLTNLQRALKGQKAELGYSLAHASSEGRVGLAFLLVIIVIEIGALARWVSYPVFPSLPTG